MIRQATIKTYQTEEQHLDVNRWFADYKSAIPEHPPIQLSNGLWLHTYRLTPYNWDGGQPYLGECREHEQEAWEREAYG